MNLRSSVVKQVEAAKKQLEDWPDWMRKASRFEGADAPNVDREPHIQGIRKDDSKTDQTDGEQIKR